MPWSITSVPNNILYSCFFNYKEGASSRYLNCTSFWNFHCKQTAHTVYTIKWHENWDAPTQTSGYRHTCLSQTPLGQRVPHNAEHATMSNPPGSLHKNICLCMKQHRKPVTFSTCSTCDWWSENVAWLVIKQYFYKEQHLQLLVRCFTDWLFTRQSQNSVSKCILIYVLGPSFY